MDPNQQNTPGQVPDPTVPEVTPPATADPMSSSTDFTAPSAATSRPEDAATQSAEAEALGDVESSAVEAPTEDATQPVAMPAASGEGEKKSHTTRYLLIALGVVVLLAAGVFVYLTYLS